MRNKWKFLNLILFGLFLVMFFFLSTTVSTESLQKAAFTMGGWGPALIAVAIMTTQVFAFLSTTPVLVAGIRLYGYGPTLGIYYACLVLTSASNFYLARRYGVKLLLRMIGRDNVQLALSFSEQDKRILLLVGRTFGYFFCDVLSYAAGLTNLGFGEYMAYTVVLTPIPVAAEYFIFRHLDFSSFLGLCIYYGSIALSGLTFLFLIHHNIARDKKRAVGQLP
jgi:uncharacterized membrane protein YdjX (TVP38/TMEM64 family)